MALVDGTDSGIGYGKAPTPMPTPSPVPTYAGYVDDNTAYNTVVNKQAPVMAAPTPAIVKQTVPNVWDERYQTWRDPNSGLLALGSDLTGWRWVAEAEYAALQPVMAAPYSPPVGAVQVAAAKATANLPGISFSALRPDYSAPEDLTWGYPSATEQIGWGTGVPQLSDQEALTALTNPYAWEDTTAAWTDADIARVQQRYAMTEGIYSGVANVAGQHVPPFQRIATTARDASEGMKGILASAGGPGIAPSDPLYPSEENYRTWIAQWPYYTPETRAMLGQVQWAPDYVDVSATGGGGYAPWNNSMYANRITDETMVHELAHAYYANVVQPGDRQEFLTNLQRLATETDPAYAWPAYLARTYYLPAIERSLVTEGTDSAWMGGEEHGGLWSAVMGNIYQLPPYMWRYYSGMFDTSAFAPEQTRFRTGSGYEQMPIAYGPGIPGTPASKVQPSRAPVPLVAPAPPPPLEMEDAYDFYSGPITDADAYSQIMNPGVATNIMDDVRWGSSAVDPRKQAEEDVTWRMLGPGTALSEELVAAGVLIPPPPGRDLGGPYGLNDIGKNRYNADQIALYPYSDAAKTFFTNSVPVTVNSGFMRQQDAIDKGTGASASHDGIRIGDRTTPWVYPHERAHQWQWAQMGEDDASPEHQAFIRSALAALADESAPRWLVDAIRWGFSHGSQPNLSASFEVYATIAQEVPGRLHELPPYLRRYFETLYTR